MIRALLLDLDDTLFDRHAAFSAWADDLAWAQRGRSVSGDELRLLGELDARGQRSRRELANDAYARLGFVIDPNTFPAALAEHVMIEDGVARTITRLAEIMRVGIVTNGGAAQRRKLARIGLEEVVHAVFVSG
ncbi:MAG: hypothetical protein WKG01_42460, partial [Kofleriaceae bacterium]